MDECVRILDKMPERNPTDGTFELTIRCNLRCKMCLFRHDDSENAEIKSKELTAGQWIDMARQAAEAGTFNLLITGGEPLLRPDFCQIWEGIYQYGFIITLYTNATLVTPKVMETLRKYPPHRIGVTIYGASPETYEKVTGSAAAYEKMLCGVRSLQTLPSAIDYRATIIRDNYPEMDSIEALVDSFPGGHIVTEPRTLIPSVRGGCADVQSCRLSPKENIELYLRRSKKKMISEAHSMGQRLVGYRIRIEKKEPPLPSGSYRCSLFGCAAGMSSYCITNDGQLIPCQLLGQFSIDAKTKTLSSSWRELPHIVELPKLCGKCAACDIISYCAACPASRYAESGEIGGWAEYLCEDARELQKYTEFCSLTQEVSS